MAASEISTAQPIRNGVRASRPDAENRRSDQPIRPSTALLQSPGRERLELRRRRGAAEGRADQLAGATGAAGATTGPPMPFGDGPKRFGPGVPSRKPSSISGHSAPMIVKQAR